MSVQLANAKKVDAIRGHLMGLCTTVERCCATEGEKICMRRYRGRVSLALGEMPATVVNVLRTEIGAQEGLLTEVGEDASRLSGVLEDIFRDPRVQGEAELAATLRACAARLPAVEVSGVVEAVRNVLRLAREYRA